MVRISAVPSIVTAKNYNDLCRIVVEKIIAASEQSLKKSQRFFMALAGGSTPRGVYALMASLEYRPQFDWERMYFFLGDERWVPRSHSRSNYRMIADTGFPMDHVYGVNTASADAHSAAESYEQEIRTCFGLKGSDTPRFDLILLGLGQDGHTASLFPNHAALKEKVRCVVAVTLDAKEEQRITLTLPVIRQAKEILFIVSSREKAEIMKSIIETQVNCPAAMVLSGTAQVSWYIDQEAGKLLTRGQS